MYHGEESGHLIIFVNGEIIQISFKQLETKNYTFMIENQLIELGISEENGQFSYEVIPQLPKSVEDVEKTFDKHFWIPLIFLLVILNLAFYFVKHKFFPGLG